MASSIIDTAGWGSAVPPGRSASASASNLSTCAVDLESAPLDADGAIGATTTGGRGGGGVARGGAILGGAANATLSRAHGEGPRWVDDGGGFVAGFPAAGTGAMAAMGFFAGSTRVVVTIVSSVS